MHARGPLERNPSAISAIVSFYSQLPPDEPVVDDPPPRPRSRSIIRRLTDSPSTPPKPRRKTLETPSPGIFRTLSRKMSSPKLAKIGPISDPMPLMPPLPITRRKSSTVKAQITFPAPPLRNGTRPVIHDVFSSPPRDTKRAEVRLSSGSYTSLSGASSAGSIDWQVTLEGAPPVPGIPSHDSLFGDYTITPRPAPSPPRLPRSSSIQMNTYPVSPRSTPKPRPTMPRNLSSQFSVLSAASIKQAVAVPVDAEATVAVLKTLEDAQSESSHGHGSRDSHDDDRERRFLELLEKADSVGGTIRLHG